MSKTALRLEAVSLTLPMLLAAGAVGWVHFRSSHGADDFDGTASLPLSECPPGTAVLPPIPEGKNAIWCASFQLAWDRLKADVIQGPILIDKADLVAHRLNEASVKAEELPSGSSYAAAGYVHRGVCEKIRTEMGSLFPKVPVDFSGVFDGIVAYGYLQTKIKFPFPYFDNSKPFAFKDGKGHETYVASFGIREEDDYAYRKLRNQVAILYVSERPEGPVDECVIDLCRDSSPNQVVVAMLKRQGTLAEMLANMERKASSNQKGGLGINDVLLVPDIAFRIAHRFRELEGKDKRLLNPGFEDVWIDMALQTVQFSLNRGGAELASESKIVYLPIPTHYNFDRPFLVLMRKRGSASPCFVLWVENSELLIPRK